MKKIILGVLVFVLLVLSTTVLAQSTKWEDYGLSEEAVKYLTDKEKQDILSSKTPAQTEEYYKKGIQDGSIKPEDAPFPFLNQESNTGATPLSKEVVSCFDYYTFGSIESPIQSRTTNAVSGTDMTFYGNIVNKNPYPVVEGTLYVKIMKNIGTEKNPNGPDVVDQFIAVDNVNLNASSTVPVEFKWKVPAYATTGDYRVVTYFTSDKKFNLQGLSFTDDIVGNSFDFKVSGEQEELISFDKSSVVINNDPYYFAAYPPRIQKGEKSNVSLEVLNDTNTDQNAQIKWKLYKWDAMNPDNLVREFTTNTNTKANTNTKVEVSISEESEPVYLLVGELTYKDTKSIVNIRFVREGVDKVRLNYPAVTSYPLKAGEQTTLFSCLHNSGQSTQVQNNKIIVEVKDEKGKVVESYTYEGAVTGDMMAVKKDFTPKSTLNKFSVHASLYTDGVLVDQSVMEYDCALIDPTTCTQKTSFSLTQIILALVSLLLLIIAITFIKTKTKGIEVVVLLCILSGSLLLFDVGVSDLNAITRLPAGYVNPSVTSGSRQVAWNTTILKTFYYFWNNSGKTTASGWNAGLKNPNITVKYNTKIINLDTQIEIVDGSIVPLKNTSGNPTRLRLQFIPHHPYDVYWVGTGYSLDSPYGEWATDATPPALVGGKVTCTAKDFLDKVKIMTGKGSFSWLDVHIPLVISPPTKIIVSGSNLSCGSVLGDEDTGYYSDCTVTATGTLNPVFNFSDTFGKFYYRYWDYRDSPRTCNGNQVSLIDYKIGVEKVPVNPYILQVPAKTISYTLTATTTPAANQPPLPPTITQSLTSGLAYNYTFVATDPDNNQIKYEIDWNDDGIGEEFSPSGAAQYVNSGISSSASKTWISLPQTFKVRTVDQYDAVSTWTTHTTSLTFSASCTNSGNLVINEGLEEAGPVTFTSSVTNETVPVSYQWYKGNNLISGATGSTYTINSVQRTDNTGTNSQWVIPISVKVTNGDADKTIDEDSCFVTITDKNIIDLCNNIDGNQSIVPDTTIQDKGNCLCINGKIDPPACIGGDGETTPVISEFFFNPDTVSPGQSCPLFLTVSGVKSCELRNRLGVRSVGPFFDPIQVQGDSSTPIGTHTLWCDTITNPSSFAQIGVPKSCFSDSNIKEN